MVSHSVSQERRSQQLMPPEIYMCRKTTRKISNFWELGQLPPIVLRVLKKCMLYTAVKVRLRPTEIARTSQMEQS